MDKLPRWYAIPIGFVAASGLVACNEPPKPTPEPQNQGVRCAMVYRGEGTLSVATRLGIGPNELVSHFHAVTGRVYTATGKIPFDLQGTNDIGQPHSVVCAGKGSNKVSDDPGSLMITAAAKYDVPTVSPICAVVHPGGTFNETAQNALASVPPTRPGEKSKYDVVVFRDQTYEPNEVASGAGPAVVHPNERVCAENIFSFHQRGAIESYRGAGTKITWR